MLELSNYIYNNRPKIKFTTEKEIDRLEEVMKSPVCLEVPKGDIWWVYNIPKRCIDFVGH